MVLLSALQVTLAEIEGIFRGLLVKHKPGLMEAAAGAGSEAGLAVLDAAKPGLMADAVKAAAQAGQEILEVAKPALMEAAAGAGSEAGLAVLDGGVVPQPDFPELPSLSPLEYQTKKVLFGCSWRDLDGCSGVMRSLICLRAPVLLQLLWR